MRSRQYFANIRAFWGRTGDEPAHHMKPFTLLAALIFLVVAAAHAYRVYAAWAIVVGPYDLPMWVSYAGVVVPLSLAFLLLREARS